MKTEMEKLRFHLIEHRDVSIKQTDDFIEMRIVSLYNDCDIFYSSFTFYLGCPYCVMLFLFSAIKPTEEQAGTLGLLTSIHTTQIEKNVWILTKKLFYNADNRLRYLFITRRTASVHIGQVKPIGDIVGIRIIVKCHRIINAIVCMKYYGSIFIIRYIIRRMVIDIANIKYIHNLCPLKIIISGLSGLFLSPLALCILCARLIKPSLLDLTSTLQQRKEILASPLVCCIFCIHHYLFLHFCCKVTNKKRNNK